MTALGARSRYCGDCGAPVVRGEGDGAVCPECGSVVQTSPELTVAGILTREGPAGPEVLLVRRRPTVRRGAGLYCLPGQRVRRGVDVRAAVKRAFRDLTGLGVEVGDVYEVHSSSDGEDGAAATVSSWFRVASPEGDTEAIPGCDADAAEWFPLDRLPALAYATEAVVLRRLRGHEARGEERRGEADLSARLHLRQQKYRELLDAYTHELMRGAWINELHLKLSKSTAPGDIAALAAEQLAARVEVDAVRIWRPGPPDRCDACPWAERCSRDRCLHLVASVSGEGGADTDVAAIPAALQVSSEEERVPLNPGVPAADVALRGQPVRAELPGAGAQPRRFEGFPLDTGEDVPGVLGLISRVPLDFNARRLFEMVARHMGTLIARATLLEDLRVANQVKLGFIARMSHELKTPLTAILGYSELLREELLAAGHEMGADGAATIEESGRKLLGIVESILEIASLQSGAVRFRPDRIDLAATIARCLEARRKDAEKKGLALDFVVPEGADTTVWADPRRTRQVVEHLLDNALKFTNRGGSVAVRLRPDEEWLTCEVADTGIGIAPEYHKSIFEAFVQVSEKMYLEYGGLGIGLSFAKILVEQQGGRIWVESRPGEGARFTFSLPRHASSHRRGGTDRVDRPAGEE